jgi:spore coat protein H
VRPPVGLRLRVGLLTLLSAWAVASLHAAPPTNPEAFFGLTNVWEFHLKLPPGGWEALEPKESEPFAPPGPGGPGGPGRPGGPPTPREYPWGQATLHCEGLVLSNVAVRFKGNSSFNQARRSHKKPLKLDFNRGAKGRTFAGLEALMLGNNANDPAQLKEVLAYAAFARAGVPAPRTAFVRLSLSQGDSSPPEYLGLYTAVEPVDDRFLQSRFGSPDGLLVKPERLPGPRYFGEDWAAYTEHFEVKQKGTAAERKALIAFCRWVDRGSPESVAQDLARSVEPDGFLRFVAVNAWLANLDSILTTGHNYYLHTTPDGRTRLIPWDLNEAFGGHPGGGPAVDQVNLSILQPHSPGIRLLERTLTEPSLAARYRAQIATLRTNALSSTRFLADLQSVIRAIQPAVEAESGRAKAEFRRVALGETNQASSGPRLGGPGGLPNPFQTPPLADWIRAREAEVSAQLAGTRPGSRPQGDGRPGMRPGPGPGPGFGPGPGPGGRPGFGPGRRPLGERPEGGAPPREP